MKLYIVSNRLPINIEEDGNFIFTHREDKLSSEQDSMQSKYEKHWIGSTQINTTDNLVKSQIAHELLEFNYHPIFIPQELSNNHNKGYCKNVIWPLFHYFYSYSDYRQTYWEAYKKVNQLFCEQICKIVNEEDWVWVQDYQLMLLPAMLRENLPNLHIGYFHHITFPSYELFRILPERKEILKGMLGADLIGFQTHEYMRHFISSCERVLSLNFSLDEVNFGNRTVRIDALAEGINYSHYQSAIMNEGVAHSLESIKSLVGNQRLILSTGNLNYSEGFLESLNGYNSFLEHHPEYRSKVSLAIIISPNDGKAEIDVRLKSEIAERVGEINSRWATTDWTPINLFCYKFSFAELIAFYDLADIALFTSIREGMNLNAKAFAAVKNEKPGVVIISETSGAATELSDALIVNSTNCNDVENAIYTALEMPEAEQIHRLHRIQANISKQTADKWESDFLDEWLEVVIKNEVIAQKLITPAIVKRINEEYQEAHRRLIILDYDGALVPLTAKLEDAKPSSQIVKLLQRLAEDPKNQIVINSVRNAETMDKWLGNLRVSLAAEHGAIIKERGFWERQIPVQDWSAGLMSILMEFVERTPKSHLEVKDSGLAWHYQDSDNWLGNLRAHQLTHNLLRICQNQHLQIVKGYKVIEIKPADCTKGTAINKFLSHGKFDFILAIGDGNADDDMFQTLPHDACSIKVGVASVDAQYNLPSQSDALTLLQGLAGDRDRIKVDKHKSIKELILNTLSIFKRDL